jgi:hypothetical protein
MRALLWLIAIICFALWSSLAWAGFAFVDVAATWTASSSVTGAVADKWTYAVGVVGKGAVILLWALGSATLLAAPLIIGRALSFSKGLASTMLSGAGGFRHPSHRAGSPLIDRIARRVVHRYHRS